MISALPDSLLPTLLLTAAGAHPDIASLIQAHPNFEILFNGIETFRRMFKSTLYRKGQNEEAVYHVQAVERGLWWKKMIRMLEFFDDEGLERLYGKKKTHPDWIAITWKDDIKYIWRDWNCDYYDEDIEKGLIENLVTDLARIEGRSKTETRKEQKEWKDWEYWEPLKWWEEWEEDGVHEWEG